MLWPTGSTSQMHHLSLVFQGNREACQALSDRFTELDKQKRDLAVYLCEDPNQLSLEELFGTMRTFRGLFIKALKVREDTCVAVRHCEVFLLCMGMLFLDHVYHFTVRNWKMLICSCPNATKTDYVRSVLGSK